MSKNPPEIAYPDSLCAPESEKAILSCFLADPRNLIGRFHEIGSLEWFHHVVYRGMAEEMFELLEAKDTFDNVMLFQHLSDKGLMEKFGGPSFLAEINNFVPTPAHFPYYCEELSAKHLLRQSWAKLLEAKAHLVEHHDSLQEKGDLILGDLAAVEALFREQDKTLTLAEQITQWNDDWEAKARKEKTSAMPTRWPIFNLRMGGLTDGYTLIGGEYSSGKSVLMRNLMVDACVRQERPGLICNYETGVNSTISGMVCDLTGIATPIVFRPDQNPPGDKDKEKIAWALGKIAGSKLRIIHEPHLSAEGITGKARAMRDKEGDLVVAVDYLQKIPRPSHIEKNANQERELASNSDAMQKLSKEMPVIMAIQLNKDGSSRGSESIAMDGDVFLKIDGDEGLFIKKFKEGERNYHLPLVLEPACLRFVQTESN
jgi:replicative DNA helicase